MAETKFDNNQVPTMTGVLNTDGATPTRVKTGEDHLIFMSDGASGSDLGNDWAARDNSGNTTMTAEASDGSGAIVCLYIDSNGYLLTKST